MYLSRQSRQSSSVVEQVSDTRSLFSISIDFVSSTKHSPKKKLLFTCLRMEICVVDLLSANDKNDNFIPFTTYGKQHLVITS